MTGLFPLKPYHVLIESLLNCVEYVDNWNNSHKKLNPCSFSSCRYPVVVKRFHLNPGTGGKGKYCGGDGVVRELLFRRPLTLSVLTERRVLAPYGMNGQLRIVKQFTNTFRPDNHSWLYPEMCLKKIKIKNRQWYIFVYHKVGS